MPPAYLPTVTCEIAFSTDPGASPVWVDVSSYVRSVEISRGRQHELDRIEAGRLTVRLSNRDRRFDPTYTGGPYYPNVKPMRRVRVRAAWNAVTYDLFSGFIERWPPERRGPRDAHVEIEAVDAFVVLAQAHLDALYGAALSGSRVTTVLNDISWPAGDRSIDAGQSQMADSDLRDADVSALEHLQQVSESENGLLFADGKGWVVFHDRHRRWKSPYTVSQGTFGDGTGELPYIGLEPSFDADQIYNEVRLDVPGVTLPAEASDAASQTAYFKRTLHRSTLLFSATEAEDGADYLVSRFKDPFLRFDELKLNPTMDLGIWPHALGRELGDRITVKHRPPGAAEVIDRDVHIEGIRHRHERLSWETVWRLSPVDQTAYFILDDAVNGRLDFNKLGY